jgi:hypothetical protein
MKTSKRLIHLGGAAILFIAGCGKGYQVGQVDGVLIASGKPANKVRIQFIPDVDSGCKGPPSVAETDSSGHFQLLLMERDASSPQPGAVVGWHRVTLSDLELAEHETVQGLPIRFGQEFTQPGSTPLRQEIKEGQQTIELKIPEVAAGH